MVFVKSKIKNKKKLTIHTQNASQQQNVNIHFNEKPKPKRRKPKPKPKPKPTNNYGKYDRDASPYDIMTIQNRSLKPALLYNYAPREQALLMNGGGGGQNIDIPSMIKLINNEMKTEFLKNQSKQPLALPPTLSDEEKQTLSNEEKQTLSDEEKFKRFNEAKYKHYDELQKNDKSKTTKEKKKMIFDYIQNATPIKDDISQSQHKTDDLIEATVKKKLGRPMNPRPINPTPKQPVGRPRKPLPINPMQKKARGRPRKNYIIGQAEEEED